MNDYQPKSSDDDDCFSNGCHTTKATQGDWREELKALMNDSRTGLKESSDTNKTRYAILALFDQLEQESYERGKMEAARKIGWAAAEAGIAVKNLDSVEEWEQVREKEYERGKNDRDGVIKYALEQAAIDQHKILARAEERTRTLEEVRSKVKDFEGREVLTVAKREVIDLLDQLTTNPNN